MSRSVLAVVIALAFVVCSRAEPPKAETLKEYVLKNKTRHAIGLYMQGKKVGWMITELGLDKVEGREVAVEKTEMTLSLVVEGNRSETVDKETIHYSLEGDGPIIYAREVKIEDKKETIYTAVPAANGLSITTKGGDAVGPRQVPMPKANLDQSRRLMKWLESGPKANDSFEHWATEWDGEMIDTKETMTFLGQKEVVVGGLKAKVYRVKVNMKGAVLDTEILANGNPISGKIGNIIEMRAEAEETVKNLDKGGIDLIEASSIRVDKNLGDSTTIKALTLEVTGLSEFKVPESHRQHIRTEDGKTVLELKADFRQDKGSALSDADRKKFTTATPTIQSDHERVKKLAADIVGKETDPLKQARQIKTWVHDKLKQRLDANSSTTLGVLERMAGDCTEHTLLFVSLARAAGLPARDLTGVAHVGGTFGWHAWAEFHDGHQWVSVDPTWDELYVDATHIVFSHDSEDHSWLNVLGNVKFKALKVERNK